MGMQDHLLFSRRDDVATITLNRVERMNALDPATCEALRLRLVEAAQDSCIRAVILTGAQKAFCAGGDLRFALDANPEKPGDSFRALTAILHACIKEIREMPKPVIAAINGPAAGAGFFLALACDVRIMAASAYLRQSNTSHGLSVPAGGSFTLPRLVGLARALEIVMLDEPMSASRALELGLVNRVVPDAALYDEAHKLAVRIAKMPAGVLGRVKRLMNSSYGSTLEEQLAIERQEIAASADSPEGREGIHAFLEKRQPDFVAVGDCAAREASALSR